MPMTALTFWRSRLILWISRSHTFWHYPVGWDRERRGAQHGNQNLSAGRYRELPRHELADSTASSDRLAASGSRHTGGQEN